MEFYKTNWKQVEKMTWLIIQCFNQLYKMLRNQGRWNESGMINRKDVE